MKLMEIGSVRLDILGSIGYSEYSSRILMTESQEQQEQINQIQFNGEPMDYIWVTRSQFSLHRKDILDIKGNNKLISAYFEISVDVHR